MAAEPTVDGAESPDISVIFPPWGRAQVLLDCVASILRNDCSNFVIIDQDRERALSAELEQRFGGDRRLVYLVLEEPHASRARTSALAMRGVGSWSFRR